MQSIHYNHERSESSINRDKLLGGIEQQFRHALRATDWSDSRRFVAQALRLAAQGYRQHIIDVDDIALALKPISEVFAHQSDSDPALGGFGGMTGTIDALDDAYTHSQDEVNSMIDDLDEMAGVILGES